MFSVKLKIIIYDRQKRGYIRYYRDTYITSLTKIYNILLDLADLFNKVGEVKITSSPPTRYSLIFTFRRGRGPKLSSTYKINELAEALRTNNFDKIPTIITVYRNIFSGPAKDFNIDQPIGEIIKFFRGSVELDTGLDTIEYNIDINEFVEIQTIDLNLT